jgi:patatin-like phospholipase/acyl hydrolase
MSNYKILSLDGGGIRGMVTVVLLQKISQQLGSEDWLKKFNLIAGTSTGGLLTLALAHGLDLQTMRDVYVNKGEDIFDDSWLDDLKDLGKIMGADYDIRNLEKELKRIFGETKLKDMQRRMLVTAFDLDNEATVKSKRTWKPKIFHNFPGNDNDGEELAYKVGLYTAAAPTYFESVDGYIDGGVFANNPSMCALAQALDQRTGEATTIENISLLSIGTGTNLEYIKGQSLDWGYAQWAKPLVSLMLDGINGIADYQCRQILSGRYYRLAPVFPEGSKYEMDAVDKIDEMIAFAETVDVNGVVEWVGKNQ